MEMANNKVDVAKLFPQELLKLAEEVKELTQEEIIEFVSTRLVFKKKYNAEYVVYLMAVEKACDILKRPFKDTLRKIKGAPSIRNWQYWKLDYAGIPRAKPTSWEVLKNVPKAAVSAAENADGSFLLQWRDSKTETVFDILVPAEMSAEFPALPDYVTGSFGSFCTGIEMVGVGAEANGLQALWGVDPEPNCVENVQKNFPHVKMYPKKVDQLTDEEIRSMARAFVVHMSTPCQHFSGANLAAKWWLPLNKIAFDCLTVIQQIKPAIVTLENVAAMAQGTKFDNIVIPILAAWESLGYTLKVFILHGTDAGSCQTRPRTIVIGYRNDVFNGLTPSMPPYVAKHLVDKIKDVIPDAIEIITGDGAKERQWPANGYLGTVTRQGMTVITATGERNSIEDEKKVFGLPDWYQLVGTDSQKRDRLGNAVIPKFAEWLYRHIIAETAMILPQTQKSA